MWLENLCKMKIFISFNQSKYASHKNCYFYLVAVASLSQLAKMPMFLLVCPILPPPIVIVTMCARSHLVRFPNSQKQVRWGIWLGRPSLGLQVQHWNAESWYLLKYWGHWIFTEYWIYVVIHQAVKTKSLLPIEVKMFVIFC